MREIWKPFVACTKSCRPIFSMSDRAGSRTSFKLDAKVRRALLSYAIFRWESAVTLAITLVLIAFIPDPFRGTVSFWRPWFWPLLGLVSEMLIIATTVTDPAVRAQIVRQALRARYDPTEIASRNYRAPTVRALEYRDQLETLIQHARTADPRRELQSVASAFDGWLTALFGLARRLDYYQRSEGLRPDPSALLDEIAQIKARLQGTLDAVRRYQLERELETKRKDLQQLEVLNDAIARAAQHLQDSLAAMGAAYAQAQLLSARSEDHARWDQLRQEMVDQTAEVYDQLHSLNIADPLPEA